MRVGDLQRSQNAIEVLQRSVGAIDRAQRQVATGKRVQRPSDAPIDAASITVLRSAEADIERQQRATADADAWFAVQDGSLQSASTLLARAKQLGLQAMNGALDAGGLAAISSEIDGIRAQMVSIANSSYLGQAVFGAFGTQAVTTTATTATFTGTAGAKVQRQIGPGQVVAVNTDGAAVFGFTAGNDVFGVLQRLSTAVQTGDTAAMTTENAALDTRASDIRTALGDVGARWSSVTNRQEQLVDRKTELASQRSQIEDVDVNEAAMQLAQASRTYEGIIASIARMQQMSLVDFLR
jgi:flagellar hook-associated protein 3 FlgL